MKFRAIAALIAAIAVFAVWMSIVGNPHVVETVIGLILAAGVFIFVSRWRRK